MVTQIFFFIFNTKNKKINVFFFQNYSFRALEPLLLGIVTEFWNPCYFLNDTYTIEAQLILFLILKPKKQGFEIPTTSLLCTSHMVSLLLQSHPKQSKSAKSRESKAFLVVSHHAKKQQGFLTPKPFLQSIFKYKYTCKLKHPSIQQSVFHLSSSSLKIPKFHSP